MWVHNDILKDVSKVFAGKNILEEVLGCFRMFMHLSWKPLACFKRALCLSHGSIQHAPMMFQVLNVKSYLFFKSKH